MSEKAHSEYLKDHYKFGENWKEFSEKINQTRIDTAKACLQKLIPASEIKDKTFLDIGSGSGLHSLAALQLGAKHVDAFDVDPDSVETTKKVLENYFNKNNYSVSQKNILDFKNFQKKYDIVYSWGVLHHTGSMWEAIEKASKLVKENGLFVIAIYKKTRFCEMWKSLKKTYCQASDDTKKLFEINYKEAQLGKYAHNPDFIKQHEENYIKSRGMSWDTDVKDWLGGYPYESATPQEIVDFIHKSNFLLEKAISLIPPGDEGRKGTGCAQYVFRKLKKNEKLTVKYKNTGDTLEIIEKNTL